MPINGFKITIVGSGYVGMSLAVVLAQNNIVTVLDIDPDRVSMINNNQSTIIDSGIENFLQENNLNLTATLDNVSAYKGAQFIVIATPTDYDPETNSFDTGSVDLVIGEALKENPEALIIIKSTVPVGHTDKLRSRFKAENIVFSPEFLREGQALYDNLNPSRIVMGCRPDLGEEFAQLLRQGAQKKDIETLFMQASEAEAVKLFSNTYLAMRIAFFNELDSYAMLKNMQTRSIIDGVCLDGRVGKGYNNPSFGYGGYCLPKDTKQLLANYDQVPQTLISAIVTSNSIRKDLIANEVISRRPSVVGFYRLVMKEGSDNFRSSAIQDIMHQLRDEGIEVIIFEPSLSSETYLDYKVFNDFESFAESSSLILANRRSKLLDSVQNKLLTRDVYGGDI